MLVKTEHINVAVNGYYAKFSVEQFKELVHSIVNGMGRVDCQHVIFIVSTDGTFLVSGSHTAPIEDVENIPRLFLGLRHPDERIFYMGIAYSDFLEAVGKVLHSLAQNTYKRLWIGCPDGKEFGTGHYNDDSD